MRHGTSNLLDIWIPSLESLSGISCKAKAGSFQHAVLLETLYTLSLFDSRGVSGYSNTQDAGWSTWGRAAVVNHLTSARRLTALLGALFI